MVSELPLLGDLKLMLCGSELTAVNSASFEDGMNLGKHPKSHGTGNDIDLFRIYRDLTGASQRSGTAHYVSCGSVISEKRCAFSHLMG